MSALTDYPARYFGAWNDGEIGVVDGLLADEFTWTDPSLPAPLTTREDARGFFEGSWAAFPDMHFEMLGGPAVDGDRVAHEWRMTGTHTGAEFPPGVPASGKSFSVDGTDVFTVGEDGRATKSSAYWDALTLMRQLGLAE